MKKNIKSQKIISCVKIGERNCIDLEVDSKFHNFSCNNIIVSNSHSTGYAYLAGMSVYLKSNYPKEFFLCCLKHVKDTQKPLEEITNIKAELPYFGIELLPPHIIKSNLEFSIEGPNIRFGLAEIKGIAEKSIHKINNFKNEYSNKFEIFQAANEAEIPISILGSLILVGALDNDKIQEKRSKLLLEAQLWNLLKEPEKALAKEHGPKFNYNLTETLKHLIHNVKNEKEKPVIKESRAATIRNHFAPYLELYKENIKNENYASYIFETELLGYAYSFNLREIFQKQVPDLISISEATSSLEDSMVHIIGKATETKEWVAKNEKKTKTFKFTLTDELGSTNVLMFNERIDRHLDENGRKVVDGDIVLVRGRKKGDSIFADQAGIQKQNVFMKKSDIKKNFKQALGNKEVEKAIN